MKPNSFLVGFLLMLATSASAQTIDSMAVAQRILIKRADSLMANYQFEKALDNLVECDSLDANVLLRIGQCNYRMGASRAAIRPYERVLKMDSTNITALNQLAQLYARDADFTRALQSYHRLIALDAYNAYYYKQAGYMSARLDNMPTAKALYLKVLHFNPTDAEASLALGTILMDLEEYESVDSVVERAMIFDHQYKPILLLKARSAFEQQRYPLVISTVNRLLEMSDTTAIVARLLGASYFHLKEHEKVIECMNFLLKNRYDADWIYYYLGVASRELGNAQMSINYFKKAVQKSISANSGIYYSQLGQSYEEVKDYQLAIKAYRAAYNTTGDQILFYHLARNYDVYYKDKAPALAYYHKYLNSDDTIRKAKEYSRSRIRAIDQY